jgi:hypothetical protein
MEEGMSTIINFSEMLPPRLWTTTPYSSLLHQVLLEPCHPQGMQDMSRVEMGLLCSGICRTRLNEQELCRWHRAWSNYRMHYNIQCLCPPSHKCVYYSDPQ